jgi:hypothetical protein
LTFQTASSVYPLRGDGTPCCTIDKTHRVIRKVETPDIAYTDIQLDAVPNTEVQNVLNGSLGYIHAEAFIAPFGEEE